MKNEKVFHNALHELDTEMQTYGCRYSNPDICKNNSTQNICAFVRNDNICLRPSRAWKKQYRKLAAEKNKSGKS